MCFLSVIYIICQISDPDCYRLVQGKDIYQSTTLRITTYDTSATIDFRKTELFPLYVLIIIIIIVVSFIFILTFVVGLYIRKFIIYILLGSQSDLLLSVVVCRLLTFTGRVLFSFVFLLYFLTHF